MSRPAQILAMGGGGFSMEPDNLALDRYLLRLTGRERPKVCFVPTASGDAEGYIEGFYRAFKGLECEPSHLGLFRRNHADLRAHVCSQDAIYVGGGNTRNMLVLWKEYGLDELLREAWRAGVVLAGLSAGSLCWFESGVTDSNGPFSAMPCMGLLPGSHCPHYDSEPERRPAYHELLAAGALGPGYAADDGAALHFVATTLTRVVGSRPDARAYRVELGPQGVVETVLTPDLLS